MARPLWPMMSERTEPSLRLVACSSLSMRCTWLAFSRVSCLRVRVRSRSACTSIGGTKLGRISPWPRRSASQVASFTSVPARHGFDVVSIGQDENPIRLAQHGPDRLPIDARGLHDDVADERTQATTLSL